MAEPCELVVLLDENGQPIGTADKSEVHTTETPLHLAFSCHVFNDAGQILVTRRALDKKTWPGVWTNSFCGHPGPDEDFESAISRRAQEELGLVISEIQVAVPDFRYRAIDASGIVENEICPVYIARTSAEPKPNPREVSEYVWADAHELFVSVRSAPFAFSPWLTLQLPKLAEAGLIASRS